MDKQLVLGRSTAPESLIPSHGSRHHNRVPMKQGHHSSASALNLLDVYNEASDREMSSDSINIPIEVDYDNNDEDEPSKPQVVAIYYPDVSINHRKPRA